MGGGARRGAVCWRWLVSLAGVDVLHVDLATGKEFDQAALGWLDEAERARWKRFGAEAARRRYARCRAALRAVLCQRLDCANGSLAFGTGAHGKPFAKVAGSEHRASFNVSHSHDHGLIAFAADSIPLGIDVEMREHRGDLRAVAERVFAASELAWLARHSGEQWRRAFFRLWTCKEAAIKALGTGFTLAPQSFAMPQELLDGASSARFDFPHAPERRWFVADLGEQRFAAALVAGERSPATPRRC